MTEKIPDSSGFDFNRVLPVFALVFVDVLGLTVILPLLHLYAAAYGASPAEIGLVVASFPLAQLIGVPVMGALSDRFGRKPLLLISQITTFISFIMLGMASSLTLIILSRVLDGLFGANISTAQAALSDITDEKNRARGLGLIGAAFGLGFIFGPITALITLEITDNLAIPAFTAAGYSFISILLTLFLFKETLPPEKRGIGGTTPRRILNPATIGRMLVNPRVNILLVLMFAQQLIFFGFEALMGVFTLSRLGVLGQGNALFFLFIGGILVLIQVRYIGKWTQRYGERKVAIFALAMFAIGLLLVATTPEQPHLFYVQRNAEYDLREQIASATEAIVGDLGVMLPPDGNNGIMGVVWFAAALIPLSIGAGLIRPCLNSLMTKRVSPQEYGTVLGVSASFVSAADAVAPILGGIIFQTFGGGMPFLLGGLGMAGLVVASWVLVKD